MPAFNAYYALEIGYQHSENRSTATSLKPIDQVWWQLERCDNEKLFAINSLFVYKLVAAVLQELMSQTQTWYRAFYLESRGRNV